MTSASLAMLLAGALLGAAVAWLLLRGRAAAARHAAELLAEATRVELGTRLAERDVQLLREREERARREAEAQAARAEARTQAELRAGLESALDEERRGAAEKALLLGQAQERLSDAFKALSSDVLQAQSRQFLELAKESLERFQEGARGDLTQRQTAIAELLAPVRESVGKLGERLGEMERSRVDAYSELRQQVRTLGEGQGMVRQEAAKLVQALRAPQVRGRWGEMQLRRVAEIAGMQAHCDFVEQGTVEGIGGKQRPDMLVRMPGGRQIPVDAKAPLAAYLDSLEAPDDGARQARLADHARQLRDHVAKLSQKAYHQAVGSPEFVVLFLPGEAFLYAALDQDPRLMERAAEAGVLVVTPMTLIGFLRTVERGWREEAVAENARHVTEAGQQLHDRIAKLAEHLERLGKSLSGSVRAYNDFVGSLESRVLPAARRMKELGAGTRSLEVPILDPVDEAPRSLRPPGAATGS